LVGFFKSALQSLAPKGSIVVTLFEGTPYTLWNIRDLARHSGLQVERSFKFQASAYPGYHHARTLGTVKSKTGETSETGWKGEDRLARSYVFMRKGEVPAVVPKRKRGSDDDESEDEVEYDSVDEHGMEDHESDQDLDEDSNTGDEPEEEDVQDKQDGEDEEDAEDEDDEEDGEDEKD
jgi:25S rRNA (uracil2634-N3)-methyltransferase